MNLNRTGHLFLKQPAEMVALVTAASALGVSTLAEEDPTKVVALVGAALSKLASARLLIGEGQREQRERAGFKSGTK